MQGLDSTSPPAFDNVMCPSNATSALDCSSVSPPTSPRCFKDGSAAGVKCIQGMYVVITIPSLWL